MKEELIIGKTYEVNHSRKGKFNLELKHQCNTWASGIITNGFADSMLEENIKEQFEEITVRKELCTFKPL